MCAARGHCSLPGCARAGEERKGGYSPEVSVSVQRCDVEESEHCEMTACVASRVLSPGIVRHRRGLGCGDRHFSECEGPQMWGRAVS